MQNSREQLRLAYQREFMDMDEGILITEENELPNSQSDKTVEQK